MDSINYLLGIFIAVTLLHLVFVTRLSVKFSIPWLLPESNTINYPKFNPSSDRLRSLLSLVAFFSPLFMFKGYRGLLIENETINVSVLLILISLSGFLLYCNKNKIWSQSFRSIKNPKQLMSAINVEILQILNRIDETIFQHSEKINSIQNDNNQIISQFVHLENKTTEIQKNSKQLVSAINVEIFQTMNRIDKTIFQNSEKINSIQNDNNEIISQFVHLENKTTEIQSTTQDHKIEFVKIEKATDKIVKEIEAIKKKTIVKPRESQKRQQRIDKIEAGFKLFISELESFPEYNAKEKTIDFKKFELTELQSYQTMVEFFIRNYDVPKDNTYSAICKIFNSHFKIKDSNLHINNRQDFKNRLLPDIENNYLFNDLRLIRNKSTQQLSDSSKRHI